VQAYCIFFCRIITGHLLCHLLSILSTSSLYFLLHNHVMSCHLPCQVQYFLHSVQAHFTFYCIIITGSLPCHLHSILRSSSCTFYCILFGDNYYLTVYFLYTEQIPVLSAAYSLQVNYLSLFECQLLCHVLSVFSTSSFNFLLRIHHRQVTTLCS